MANNFNMCPMCGSKKIQNPEMRKWICPDCGFDLYNNVAAAVGIIIYDKDNNLLFEVRAKEPRKGFIALPGGFVDFAESAEKAVVRECREEIGVEIDEKDLVFLCSNPNVYPYKGIEYKTCDIFFMIPLPGRFNSIEDFIGSLKAEESEVAGLCSYRVQSEDDVEKLPLAFDSARATLKKFVKIVKR